MSTLLSIDVSPSGDKSITLAFGNRFTEHCEPAHPVGTVVHLGRPEEIAKALVFLTFDATFTSGAELRSMAVGPNSEGDIS
jgi:FMN-dependent NADH-azoreductase